MSTYTHTDSDPRTNNQGPCVCVCNSVYTGSSSCESVLRAHEGHLRTRLRVQLTDRRDGPLDPHPPLTPSTNPSHHRHTHTHMDTGFRPLSIISVCVRVPGATWRLSKCPSIHPSISPHVSQRGGRAAPYHRLHNTHTHTSTHTRIGPCRSCWLHTWRGVVCCGMAVGRLFSHGWIPR